MQIPADIIKILVFVSMALTIRSKQTIAVITPPAKLKSRLTVFLESFLNKAPISPPRPVPPMPASAVASISVHISFIFSPTGVFCVNVSAPSNYTIIKNVFQIKMQDFMINFEYAKEHFNFQVWQNNRFILSVLYGCRYFYNCGRKNILFN